MNGLILKGGSSKRMGRDKAFIVYDNSRPYLEELHDLLLRFTEKVYISVSETDPDITFPQIPDVYPLRSPLNGILSAFRHSKVPWLIISCDMPCITPQTLLHIKKARDPAVCFTGFYNSDGTEPEPMIGIWEPRCAELLISYLAGGGDSPRKFIMTHPAKLIQAPNKVELMNVNSPADIEKAREIRNSSN